MSKPWLGFRLIFLVITIFVQSSCTPKQQEFIQAPVPPTRAFTATAGQVPLDLDCLRGKWQVDNFAVSIAASYQAAGSPLRLEAVQGRALYEMTDQGEFKMSFERLAAKLAGTMDDVPMQVVQVIDGSALASYSVDAAQHEILITDFRREGVAFTLDINGQRLAEGDIPFWQAFSATIGEQSSTPAPLVAYSRLSAQCRGDMLRLQVIDPVIGPEIGLRRAQ